MATEEQVPQLSQNSSLVKRLAGPSSGKAGLAKDQTEINRIIAKASEGSKFYENEKKKDKALTERIAHLLKERDAAVKGVDLVKVEQGVDRLLADLEAQRDLTQFVVHVDMDAFYASVELLHNPDLAGKPFAVGRGVLTTASYEARKYGCRSGMPGFIAKKLCPELIIVRNHFDRYQEMSHKVMNIFRRYDPTMQAAGCDEGYLNITKYCREHDLSADECVMEMRAKVCEETKLTVSAGIAPNKMLAKICSDKNKPNGQFHLPFSRRAIMEFTRDLSIRKIPMIGRVSERLLESVGIKTCGDIYTHRAMLAVMDKTFGLESLLYKYLGMGSNVVQPGQREERKSIGSERTFNTIDSQERIFKKLEEIATELEGEMESGGWAGRTVTLKYKLDTFQVFTRAKSFSRLISSKEDLLNTGKELLLPEWPVKLRLIGLRVTKLKDLRAPESNSGIKRFLKPPSTSTDTRPAKRQKIEESSGEEHNPMDGMDSGSDDDDYDEEAGLDSDDELPGVVSARSAKPLSTSEPRKERDKHAPEAPSDIKPTAQQDATCPICGKTWSTDNDGLNAHVDFCLSKMAIREAQCQASASITERPQTHKSPAANKPRSAGIFKPVSRGKR